MPISHAVQMLKRIPSLLSPSRWLYYGMAMVFADILLMMMRYLGVVLKTNALAELVMHHGADSTAQTMLHIADALNLVPWKAIGIIMAAGILLIAFGLRTPQDFRRRRD